MTRITISLTEEAIRKGTPNSINFCPIARAFRLFWPDAYVTKGGFVYRRSEPYALCLLPHEAVRWMAAYDQEVPMRPITFEVEVSQ